MTTHEINLLIERYLDGETTLAEERELALAVQREDRPAEWAIIAEMLGELTVDEAVYDEIMENRKRKPAKRLTRLWPWAACACVALAFGLSYNIIKDAPQETTKVGQPQPAKTQQEHKPVLVARVDTIQPLVRHNKPKPQKGQLLAEEQASPREPLPEVEPQLVAEVQDLTPPSEDLALCMALLAEVEARAIMLQQTAPTLDLPACNKLFVEDFKKCSDLSLPSQGRVGDGSGGPMGLLLTELLINIQQQSNRPELSL